MTAGTDAEMVEELWTAAARSRPAAVVHPRWARVVGALWLAAGVALVLAGVVLLVDQHRLGVELPAGLPAGVVGWWFWHRTLVVDGHGLQQRVGWRHTRLLWNAVERVTVETAPAAGAVRVRLAGRDEPVVLAASWGTTRPQRQQLLSAVHRAADRFDVQVDEA